MIYHGYEVWRDSIQMLKRMIHLLGSLLYRFQGLKSCCKPGRRTYGGLAQLGERLPCKQEVSGSNPLISTIYGLIAQLVRAHA